MKRKLIKVNHMKKSVEDEFLDEVETSIKNHSKKRKGINSKQKGSGAERELVKILNEHFKGDIFMRSPSSGAFVGKTNRSRTDTMSDGVAEIFTSDVVPKSSEFKFKFSIEHKFYKEASFWDLFNDSSDLHRWFKQAESDAASINKFPMLVVKYNQHDRIVYIKNQCPIEPVFIHMGWKCYNFNDFINLPNEYFFDSDVEQILNNH